MWVWVANAYLYAYTVLHFAVWFVGLVCVWLLTFAWDGRRRVVHWYLSAWCWVYMALNPFWHFRVEGREHLRGGACVLVANHQSMLDIVVLFGLWYPFKWVSKRELFSVPFFGWILRLGRYVSIDRGSRADALRMQSECEGYLRGGVSVLLFPEGTRSGTGRVGGFKPGAFAIAQSAGVPVVPMVVVGPREALSGYRFAARRVEMRIRIMPRVAVDGVDSVRDVTRRVGESVAAAHAGMAPYFYG